MKRIAIVGAGTMARVRAQALRATFDLLLLDLILPGCGGFEILKATREARPTLPVTASTK